MANIRKISRNLFANGAAINAALAGRAYPNEAPAHTRAPYLVYFLVSDEPMNRGVSGLSGLRTIEYQADVYARDLDEMHATLEALQSSVENMDAAGEPLGVLSCYCETAAESLSEADGLLRSIVRVHFIIH